MNVEVELDASAVTFSCVHSSIYPLYSLHQSPSLSSNPHTIMNIPTATSKVLSNNVRGLLSTAGRIRRDQAKRVATHQSEIERRAYLAVARNTSLSSTIRHKAQLGLNALDDAGGRPSKVKSRCIETGRGRGVLRSSRLITDTFRCATEIWSMPGEYARRRTSHS
jgi:small subunit ribosomal protein S14